MLMDSNKHINPLMAGIINSFAAAPKAPQCECDYDAEGDPLEYVKTSRCCPVHDDCDCCGEVKGTKKDRTLTVAGRPAWVCDECYLLCDDHGEKDCEVCAERAKQPEVRYI